MLFSTENGEPLAIINDGYLQHLRVGALYGLGAKYLARNDASIVGMIGSGGMAHSHLLAFAAVRKIKKVKVYSPNREHRESYARDMEQALDVDVIVVTVLNKQPKTSISSPPAPIRENRQSMRTCSNLVCI